MRDRFEVVERNGDVEVTTTDNDDVNVYRIDGYVVISTDCGRDEHTYVKFTPEQWDAVKVAFNRV